MTKVASFPKLPTPNNNSQNSWESRLTKILLEELRNHAASINQLNDGFSTGYSFSSPTQPGDETKYPDRVCYKTGRVLQGTIGAQYVVKGWNCVAESTTTLTWVPWIEYTGS